LAECHNSLNTDPSDCLTAHRQRVLFLQMLTIWRAGEKESKDGVPRVVNVTDCSDGSVCLLLPFAGNISRYLSAVADPGEALGRGDRPP